MLSFGFGGGDHGGTILPPGVGEKEKKIVNNLVSQPINLPSR